MMSKLVATVVAVALGVLSLVVLPRADALPASDSATAAVAAPSKLWAATTFGAADKTQLRVMRGATQVGVASITGTLGQPRFTDDRRYAFASPVYSPSSHGLLVIDTATGTSRTVGCRGCVQAVPWGGSKVVALSRCTTSACAYVARVIDLSNPSASHDLARTWSASQVAGKTEPAAPYVVVARQGRLVVSLSGRGSQVASRRLQWVDTDGSRRTLGGDQGYGQFVSSVSPGGTRLAYIAQPWEAECSVGGRVRVIDTRTGAQLSTRHVRGIDGANVTDIWWGTNGSLYGTVEWSHVDPQRGCEYGHPRSLMRRSGDHWVDVDTSTAEAVRMLSASARLVVRYRPAIGTNEAFLGTRRDLGDRVLRKVLQVAVPYARTSDPAWNPAPLP